MAFLLALNVAILLGQGKILFLLKYNMFSNIDICHAFAIHVYCLAFSVFDMCFDFPST